jgi:hypothetical protein
MGAHKDKTESTEEQEVIESLRKDGYSEVVIDRWLAHERQGKAVRADRSISSKSVHLY